jgi:hypothetical protein
MYKQATERQDLIIFVVDPGWVKTGTDKFFFRTIAHGLTRSLRNRHGRRGCDSRTSGECLRACQPFHECQVRSFRQVL